MEESNRNRSFSSEVRDEQFNGDASMSRHKEEVPVIDDDDRRPPVPFPKRNNVFHNAPYFPATDNEEAVRLARDDTCSYIVVILTFWFFVEEMDDADNKPMVYEFYENPSLDVLATCLKLTEPLFLQTLTRHDLTFDILFLSKLVSSESQYPPFRPTVKKKCSLELSLSSFSSLSGSLERCILAQTFSGELSLWLTPLESGSEGLAQWLEDSSYPNTTLSWNVIHGNDTISQDIRKSSCYYVAVGNLNYGVVQFSEKQVR
ncbi:hypothetical protein H5410_045086 [Solanum commersonii]|uniref:Uncharacterized protein n=1 Tax=Solanum commersonii TaxID=4109 RepID=A0A9J5XBS1_SOLCO|nr:hypothetical protein H5410_045086 [Solanum commersonii]